MTNAVTWVAALTTIVMVPRVPAASNGQQRPNVLVLLSDDLRPEPACFGGAAHTPRLDALARDSLVLTANHVQLSVCGPTRASLLVGRRPDTLLTVTHTSPTYWRERAGNFTTIPQMFKEAGWRTLSFGKTFDLRTSSFNLSAEWICDGPCSWSQPPSYVG
jgi:iduronate 2-sulfatase